MKEEEQVPQAEQFIRAGRGKRTSFMSDFLFLLKRTKKWWMLPLVLLLLAYGLILVLSSTGLAPYIYTLF